MLNSLKVLSDHRQKHVLFFYLSNVTSPCKLFKSVSFFYLHRSGIRDRQTQRTSNILSLPNTWAGEGVSLQPLPDPAQTHRNRECALSNRAADQNLVSEPTHEMEEREQPDLHGDWKWTDWSLSGGARGPKWRNGRREGWGQKERIVQIEKRRNGKQTPDDH